MIILGIDPGTTRIGYGVIEVLGSTMRHVQSGLLEVRGEYPTSLKTIERDLQNIIKKTKPERIGVEKLFFVRNQKTGIRVAEARGVVLNTASKMGVEIWELAPSEIKLALTGYGSATKEGVAKMVRHFVRLPEGKIIDDTTDALAIAITASRRVF